MLRRLLRALPVNARHKILRRRSTSFSQHTEVESRAVATLSSYNLSDSDRKIPASGVIDARELL